MVAARLLQGLLRRYAAGEAAAVAPSVIGPRVLDLGAGEGYVAARLRARLGAWVCAAEVGPFRRVRVPYVTYDGARLPCRSDQQRHPRLVLLRDRLVHKRCRDFGERPVFAVGRDTDDFPPRRVLRA